jgi:UDP-glucose 4-epimerase
MTKRVLVTGGAGFIGSHLTEALLKTGYLVRVVDNLVSGRREWVPAAAEFMQADIADAEICKKAVAGVDGIFHLAAMSRVTTALEGVNLCTQSNIVGTQNLLMAAQANKIRKFMYSGSSTYYGNQPVPHREYETPAELINFYGVTKHVGEQYCQLFDKLFDVPTIIFRYFNVYGPRQPQTGTYALVLGIFLKRWLNDEVLVIHGGGTQRRDFVHVRDVVNALIMGYESDVRGQILNVGSGTNISIKELADLISDKQEQGPVRAGDAKETLADIARIQKALGWNPSVSLKEGLEEMKRRMKDGLENAC